MKTRTGGGLHPSFPEAWRCVLGGALYACGLGLTAFPAFFDGDAEARRFWLGGWMVVAMLWWALMGTRMCLLIDRMLPLRLPRIGAMLRNGIALHLTLSVGLPMLLLLLWQPAQASGQAGLPALAAALWLGSAAGLLILSLPLPLAFVPGILLVLGWEDLNGPATGFAAGCTALLLAGLAWRSHAARQRHGLLAPFGVWLEDPTQQVKTILRWPGPARGGRRPPTESVHSSPAGGSLDLLATLLGQNCQTLRQRHGHRGERLTWLVFTAGAMALLAFGHFQDTATDTPKSGNLYMLLLSSAGLLYSIEKPRQTIRALHGNLHAQRAELFLAPGLPSQPQLEQAVMRQIFLSLRERVLLFALAMPAALHLTYPLNPWWALWWVCFCALSLLLGVYSAWRAWHGQEHGWGWSVALLALSLSTHYWMLTHPHAPPSWMLLAWAVFMLWTGIGFGAARRRTAAG